MLHKQPPTKSSWQMALNEANSNKEIYQIIKQLANQATTNPPTHPLKAVNHRISYPEHTEGGGELVVIWILCWSNKVDCCNVYIN